jgi:hypothetical protein
MSFYEQVTVVNLRIRLPRIGLQMRSGSGTAKIFLGNLNPNSHQKSHLSKTKKATSQVTLITY